MSKTAEAYMVAQHCKERGLIRTGAANQVAVIVVDEERREVEDRGGDDGTACLMATDKGTESRAAVALALPLKHGSQYRRLSFFSSGPVDGERVREWE